MPGTPRNKKCSFPECINKIDASKAICCSICQGWFHLTCVSLNPETSDLIKNSKNKNILWKCDTCVFEIPSVASLLNKILSMEKFFTKKFEEVMTKIDKGTLPKSTEKTQEGPKISLNTTSTHTQAQDEPDPTLDTVKDDHSETVEHRPVQKVCGYYKRGNCRHGSTGKKLIEGLKCSFFYPPKCLKFCRYRNKIDFGCTGPCDLLHPIICKNS